MVHYIKDLLQFHDYVILPDFGGFISNYEAAKRNMASATISAPTKRIAFNQSLREDDGLLVNYIAKNQACSIDFARNQVNNFVVNLNKELSANRNYVLEGIGRFIAIDETKIQFQPILKNNLLLESYGLERVVAQPIQRIKEAYNNKAVEVAKLSVETNSTDVKSTFRPWYFRAAAVLGISFLLTTMGMSLLSGNMDTAKMSFLPTQQQKEIITATSGYTMNLEAVQTQDFKLYEAVQLKAAIENPYYIVVGSFLSNVRMQRVINEMESKEFTVKTIPGPNGYTRVALVFDGNNTSKQSELQSIRASVNADAWLMGS